MFRRLQTDDGPTITFTFENKHIEARSGDTVAAALLASGHKSLRTTPRRGNERGPFCMMGACFDCLVEIDGVTVQACMTPAEPGLVVNRVKPPLTNFGEQS